MKKTETIKKVNLANSPYRPKTKKQKSRVIVAALYNMDKLPDANHGEVVKMSKSKKAHVDEQYDRAIAALNSVGKSFMDLLKNTYPNMFVENKYIVVSGKEDCCGNCHYHVTDSTTLGGGWIDYLEVDGKTHFDTRREADDAAYKLYIQDVEKHYTKVETPCKFDRIYPNHEILAINEMLVEGAGWYSTLIENLYDINVVANRGTDACGRKIRLMNIKISSPDNVERNPDFTPAEVAEALAGKEIKKPDTSTV